MKCESFLTIASPYDTSVAQMQNLNEIRALLEWQYAMGVDETVGDMPINHLLALPPVAEPAKNASIQAETRAIAPTPAPASISLAETVAEARKLAKQVNSIEALKTAIEAFEGCGLKKTARNTVFADGAADSDIMLIGEAPGADEDRQGIPFCGASGQLLDKMLGAIGLNRQENCYITNMLFWRPPGNRTPTPEELAICRPFVERHIELFKPKLLIFAGGTAAKSLLNESRGMMKLRGQSLSYVHPDGTNIPARALFHPSYLLRQPLQKKLAWQDLQAIEALLSSL